MKIFKLIPRSFLLVAFCVCLGIQKTHGQSSDYNYIMTRTYTAASAGQWLDNMKYYDLLGRPEESIGKGQSPSGSDLVMSKSYDYLGNECVKTLLTPLDANGGKYAGYSKTCNAARTFYSDTAPYHYMEYDYSPLKRITAISGPGNKWGYHVKIVDYSTQSSVNDSLGFVYFSVESELGSTEITVRKKENIGVNSLYVTCTWDEDRYSDFVFKNGLGQTVLQRRTSPYDNFDTYYLYDNFGNLSVVLPPSASSLLTMAKDTAWNTAQNDVLQKYAYLYKYDNRNRCIAKKLPGCEWAYFIYDQSDRQIFSQNGNERSRGEWSFSIPDMLGRICFTGVCKNVLNPFSSTIASQNVCAQRSDSGDYKGYVLSGISLVEARIYGVNYYDDYAFLGKCGVPVEAVAGYDASAETAGFGKCYQASAKGLLTGRLAAMVETDSLYGYLYSVQYYDNRDRVIQTKSSNHLGGMENEYLSYDFVGNVTKRKHVSSALDKPVQTEVYDYIYDFAGRLLTMKHSLNGSGSVTLGDYAYDEVGRLKCNKRNGCINLRTDYTYNIRSWIKTVQNPLFSQTLYYNDGPVGQNGYKHAYNGNISSMTWRAAGDDVLRQYNYEYDYLARLYDAYYWENSVMNDHYTTSYAYDDQGNLSWLSRKGLNADGSFSEYVDDLSFSYNGNQLQSIYDYSEDSLAWEHGFDFKDGASKKVEYTYDANGNMTQDLNRKVAEVQYNFLNLPCKIAFEDGSAISYMYSADGIKLRTRYFISDSITNVKDCCGNLIYESNIPALLLIEGGYITLNDSMYHFFLKDYQGNVRVVANQRGEVEGVNHYYPFGGVFDLSSDSQPYKYNGKELETMKGLNWYDYGARHYDGVLGRFTTVDPLAENDYSVSPYAYCGNNPVNRIDPTGAFVSPIYDENGKLLGTDDEGLKGQPIIMSELNFKQGMPHEEALGYSLGYKGLINDEARSNYVTSYTGLKDRPDYDGFVTINEGVEWAKLHPNALNSPTPDNSLYVNAGLLDFGDLTVERIGIRNTGKVYPINLFNKTNARESIYNLTLRATVYALGRFNIILRNPVIRTVSVVNDSATDYDWNGGGGFIRNSAIQLEKARTGINKTHGFKVYYYGIGKLRK